jgi:hypothetical protein
MFVDFRYIKTVSIRVEKGRDHMIGIWTSYNNVFLFVAGVAMLAAFGLPLVLVPMRWARVFRWELPQPQNLTIMLGRSLGVFICIISEAKPFFFDLMLWLFAGMLVLHVYGAIRKTQPITETIEIVLWIVLGIITLCFYPI